MKINLSCNNEVTPREMLDISQEALREVMLSDLRYGAANGESIIVRHEVASTGLTWFKVYIFKLGESSVYIDAQPIPEEEVTTPWAIRHAKDVTTEKSDATETV